jgi:hypothetical protein
MQCPYIVDSKNLIIDGVFNTAKEYECHDGSIYTFYYHWDGFDQYYNCQFCELIGRKRDVFECLNESEWHECYAYKSHEEKEL